MTLWSEKHTAAAAVCCIALAVAVGWPGAPPHKSLLPTDAPKGATQAASVTFIAHNATIWLSSKTPLVQALAVSGGIIVATGTNADMLALQSSATIVKDFHGTFILPGLIDAHVHLLGGGQTLSWVDLSRVNSRQQFAAAVKAAADTTSAGKWVMGHGWEEAHWDGQLPSAEWIDAISPHNPVLLYRMDGHMVLLNCVALQLAGIDADTAAPAGGRIDHSKSGEPTGILVDNAIALVTAYVPSLSHADKQEALTAAAGHILSKGITTVCDMGTMGNPTDTWDTLENVYRPAADKEELPLRIFSMVPLASWPKLQALVKKQGRAHHGGRLFWGGLKDFADGSLGSRTALMQEPYADDPSTRGIRLSPYADLQKLVQQADATGLQIAIHAIGDQAVDDVLTWYDLARNYTDRNSSSPARQPRRHRIEHAQHVLGAETIRQLSQQQTTAVVNPLHLLSDMHIMEDRLGKTRDGSGRAFGYHDMFEAGVPVAFASDWPVVAIEPLLGMYTAVHRKAPDMPASQAWFPAGAVTAAQALHAHTAGAAYACGLENTVGSLMPGMRADFTVLDRNLLTTLEDPQQPLPNVLATYVDGVCKYGCQDL